MVRLFMSYSHKDEIYRKEIENHFAALKRQNVIDVWHDRRIFPGAEFIHEISHHLEDADLILFLVSSDFIASDYCYDIEMEHALRQHHLGMSIVMPVILRPCDWHDAPFGKLLATPTDGKPIAEWDNVDLAFLDVVKSVKLAIQRLKGRAA